MFSNRWASCSNYLKSRGANRPLNKVCWWTSNFIILNCVFIHTNVVAKNWPKFMLLFPVKFVLKIEHPLGGDGKEEEVGKEGGGWGGKLKSLSKV